MIFKLLGYLLAGATLLTKGKSLGRRVCRKSLRNIGFTYRGRITFGGDCMETGVSGFQWYCCWQYGVLVGSILRLTSDEALLNVTGWKSNFTLWYDGSRLLQMIGMGSLTSKLVCLDYTSLVLLTDNGVLTSSLKHLSISLLRMSSRLYRI